VLDAALQYEKRTNEKALQEASRAYAGYVDREGFIAKAREDYLAVLRATSPEFRKEFSIK
jgi:hypothetical protein